MGFEPRAKVSVKHGNWHWSGSILAIAPQQLNERFALHIHTRLMPEDFIGQRFISHPPILSDSSAGKSAKPAPASTDPLMPDAAPS